MEKRTLTIDARQFQTRAAEDGKLVIEGYFAVFNSPYWLDYEGGSYETVAPTAFDDTLGDDIRALINHDSTYVLGRTAAGTLRLKVDEIGLWGEIEINPNDSDAVNLYERVKRRDVSQCSFGFEILEYDIEILEDGERIHRTLSKVKLYEVSVVTFPAYGDTKVDARAENDALIARVKLDAWKKRTLEKLKGANQDGSPRT